MLAYHPGIAEETFRLLARYQGMSEDDWRDEQPGKILHELRVGEMANLGVIPHTPFYGTVDATPLFIILIAQHAAWTGSLRLFHDLRDSIERALMWMDTYGFRPELGYLGYASHRADPKMINKGCLEINGSLNRGFRIDTPSFDGLSIRRLFFRL